MITRDEFLAVVGDPAVSHEAALALDREAQTRWEAIRGAVFTAGGKRRAKIPFDAQVEHREIDNLRERARNLLQREYWQWQAHNDPHSHTRPDVLRRHGFRVVACALCNGSGIGSIEHPMVTYAD